MEFILCQKIKEKVKVRNMYSIWALVRDEPVKFEKHPTKYMGYKSNHIIKKGWKFATYI